MERSHLSDLMSNVQKMHNDLERSGENDRRRLEGQLQMLEGQTYVIAKIPQEDPRVDALAHTDKIFALSLCKNVIPFVILPSRKTLSSRTCKLVLTEMWVSSVT